MTEQDHKVNKLLRLHGFWCGLNILFYSFTGRNSKFITTRLYASREKIRKCEQGATVNG